MCFWEATNKRKIWIHKAFSWLCSFNWNCFSENSEKANLGKKINHRRGFIQCKNDSYVPNYYLFLDWSRTERIHITLIPNVLTVSQPQQLQKQIGCSRWVIFSSPCIYLHSWMLEILVQCRSQTSSCLASSIVCSCSFQLLQSTSPGQLTQLRTLEALQFSFLAKLLCSLQIMDRQLTLWWPQCSKIFHFNFSGLWKNVFLSCLTFPLQLSLQNA